MDVAACGSCGASDWYGQAWPGASWTAIKLDQLLQPPQRADHDREADQSAVKRVLPLFDARVEPRVPAFEAERFCHRVAADVDVWGGFVSGRHGMRAERAWCQAAGLRATSSPGRACWAGW